MMKNDFRRLWRICIVAILALSVAVSWLAPLDNSASQQIEAGMKRALVSFATARALNAVISVAQGTEVAIEPAGVGMVFTPGQILDPLNDLVEQFSNLMLAASVAFGIQKILLAIGAHWLVSVLLTVAAGFWLTSTLHWQATADRSSAWLGRLLIALLMIRFAVPVVTLGSELLFRQFMATDYQASQQAIDTSSSQAAKVGQNDTEVSGATGTVEKFKNLLSQGPDLRTHFDKLKTAAEEAAEHIIRLMAIFLLQTLVLPLLMLWGLYGLARNLTRRE